MDRPLQDFGHLESSYERPSQNWVCGRAAEGRPCPLGPGPKGICYSSYECVPLQEEGRWYCTRPVSRGGRCENGPLPDGTCCKVVPVCQPRLSLRARRKYFVVASFTVLIGMLAFGLGHPEWRYALLDAGKLTSQHAVILEADGEKTARERCAACHVAAERSLTQVITGTLFNDHGGVQDQKCLECHNLGKHDREIHSVAPAELEKVTALLTSAEPHPSLRVGLAQALGLDSHQGARAAGVEALACADCHHEHRGREFDLTRMSQEQCQICHQSAFHSFQDGHPDFGDYPYTRRTRLYFDHRTHYRRHFGLYERIMPGGQKPESCQTCHMPDGSGRTMLVAGFEAACASCHAQQIEEDPLPGLALLALPGIDAAELDAGTIGEWPKPPKMEGLDADGRLPPLMELLLSSDSKYVETVATLKGVNLRFLGDESEEVRNAAGDYVWIIKHLIYDLVRPTGELEQRLQTAFRASEIDGSIRELAARLRHPAVTAAQQKWLPNLRQEWERHREGGSGTAETSSPEEDGAEEDGGSEGEDGEAGQVDPRPVGWFRQEADQTLRYRAKSHADRLLTSLIDATVPHAGPAAAHDSPVGKLYQSLANPYSSGRCLKCHTVEKSENGRLRVNWLAGRPQHIRKFTRFEHATHFSAISGNDKCTKCHVLHEQYQMYPSQFVTGSGLLSVDANAVHDNFQQLNKQSCAECHRSGAARHDCLNCHNYHVYTRALTEDASKERAGSLGESAE